MDVLDPALGLTIAMESAIHASKSEPGTVSAQAADAGTGGG
ncbi:hypothetical protein [Mesorhizobium erdmanii]|nr:MULTISPECIES: hypothetical protein [Mesorhizobium]